MSPIELLRRYPPVLWASGLYLACLGFSFRHDVPLAILAITALHFFASHESHARVADLLREHIGLAGFLLVSIAATLHSGDRAHSLAVQLHLLPTLLLYAVIVASVSTRERLRFMLVAVIVSALVSGLSFFIQALLLTDTPDPLEKIYLIRSPLMIAPNDVLYFSVLAPLAIFMTFGHDHRAMIRLAGVIYLVMTLALTVYMQSRQAVGVFLLSAFIYVALLRPLYGLLVVVAGGLAILGVDWLLGKGLLKKLIYLFPRRYVWAAAWQMFLDQPWLGHGPGMFRILYPEYLEKAGYVLSQVEDRRPMNWAHSLFLEQLAERGIAGMVALVTLLAIPVRHLAGRKDEDMSEHALLVSVLALLLAGIAEASLLRLWTLMAVLVLAALASAAR